MTKMKRHQCFTLLLTLLILFMNINISSAFASENTSTIDSIYVSQENYADTMNNTVLPYLESIKTSGNITGQEDANLYYEKYIIKNSKGSIVISHGYSEYIERYYELIYYFAKSGYNVFIMEHRGHARSESLGIKDNSQVNVENFDYYVSDLKDFIDDVVLPINEDKKLFLYAHSMGGAIGANFLIDNPDYFDLAVLNAPMMTINTGFPQFFSDIFASSASLLGFADSYAPGQSSYKSEQKFEDAATGCLNRFNYTHNLEISNTSIQKGGISIRWLNKSLDATQYITSKKNASKVEIPVLLFQAENDSYVKSHGQNKFAKYAKNCTLITIENSKHEIYRESDKILKPVLKNIIDFYNTTY